MKTAVLIAALPSIGGIVIWAATAIADKRDWAVHFDPATYYNALLDYHMSALLAMSAFFVFEISYGRSLRRARRYNRGISWSRQLDWSRSDLIAAIRALYRVNTHVTRASIEERRNAAADLVAAFVRARALLERIHSDHEFMDTVDAQAARELARCEHAIGRLTFGPEERFAQVAARAFGRRKLLGAVVARLRDVSQSITEDARD